MPSLILSNVSFRYPAAPNSALTECNIEIPLGAMFAVLGPNGAGKTTLLRLLGGKFQPGNGSLLYPPNWCRGTNRLDPLLYGLLIENPGVYKRLSVREYLQFFGGFYHIANLDSRIDQDCAELGLDALDLPLDRLSLGNRQKVQLVRTLLHRPRLALLDEPVSNLDPLSRERVWNWLRHLNQNEGITAVVCSHVLGEIAGICSHVGLLKQGRFLINGTLGQVLASRPEPLRVECLLAQPLSSSELLLLTSKFPEWNIQSDANRICYTTDNPVVDNPRWVQSLVAMDIGLVELKTRAASLDSVYRAWMGDSSDA